MYEIFYGAPRENTDLEKTSWRKNFENRLHKLCKLQRHAVLRVQR